MINEKNKNNEEQTPKEKRACVRRAKLNRRASVRFTDALGRRDGIERRTDVVTKPE